MADTIVTDRFPSGVPSAVRRHGRVLDPSFLEPGDLILVAQTTPNWLQQRIQRTQAQLYPWDHAQWHHALVSGGGTEVCEAILTGVVPCQFWKYMAGKHQFKVRRIKNAPSETRTKVAYYAATMARTSYGFSAIFPIRSAINDNDPWKRSIFRSSGVVCSQLYFEACMRAGILLASMPPDRVSPAHLSASKEMDDVPLRWIELKVPQSADGPTSS
jgi:hypothetical protein